jgi:hypothetical protein
LIKTRKLSEFSFEFRENFVISGNSVRAGSETKTISYGALLKEKSKRTTTIKVIWNDETPKILHTMEDNWINTIWE